MLYFASKKTDLKLRLDKIMNFMKNYRNLKLFYVVLLLIFTSVNIFAQGDKPADKPKVSADEAKAAKKIQDAKTFTERLTASSDFIKKFPKSSLRKQVVEYISGQVFASKDDNQSITDSQSFMAAFTDPAETDAIIPSLIDAMLRLKRYDEAFATADKYLARHDDDVIVRVQLGIEGSNQLRTNNAKYAPQTKDYSSKAIQLIEANTKPANLTDDNWKEYQTKWLPELYTSLGFAYMFLNDADTAQVCFKKTVTLDEKNITGWYMLGTSINENYQGLAKKYTVASGTEKETLLKKANEALDKVIDIFARVTALTDGNTGYQPLNAQVRQDLEAYYKYRHSNSTKGMQELIDSFKVAKTN